LDSIAAAKLLAELQQLSRSSAWYRLFWRQLRPTFCCTSRSSPSALNLCFYRKKQTLAAFIGMSALGQKQTYAVHKRMSALPSIATAKPDMASRWAKRTSMTRKEWRKRAKLLPENDHRKDRGAARQPITVASMTLAPPTLRHTPSDHWQAYGIT
jgi:hypothetical protein